MIYGNVELYHMVQVIPDSLYGMKILQNEDVYCSINKDEKLSTLEQFPLTGLRRRELESIIIYIDQFSFISLNSGWHRKAASELCAFYSIHIQELLPHEKVTFLSTQSAALKMMKVIGSNNHVSAMEKRYHCVTGF